MTARPMAALAELDALTARLRDGADEYVRRVKRTVATWPSAGRDHESRAPREHDPGGASGG